MSPQGDEREAREEIDWLLTAAGWTVCDPDMANLSAHCGVAICEFPLPGHGFADYLLHVDGKAAGVIEAKKRGATLSVGVERGELYFTLRVIEKVVEGLDISLADNFSQSIKKPRV